MPVTWESSLPVGCTVLAGVSGGADSTRMAIVLSEWAKKNCGKLVIVHVNHGLRGSEDYEDEKHVRRLSAKLDATFVSRAIVQPDDHPISSEDGLRTLRLSILFEEARSARAAAIALGHHADDVAESLILMLLRGAGVDGLGSLREVRTLDGILLIRPNWSMRRWEIERELVSMGIAWRTDPSNSSMKMRRNRIRAEVIPLLESMEPSAVRLIARSAAWCSESADEADLEAERLVKSVTVVAGDGFVVLDVVMFRQASQAKMKRALRTCWRKLAGRDSRPSPPHWWLTDVSARVTNGGSQESFFALDDVAVSVTRRHLVMRAASVAEHVPWSAVAEKIGFVVADSLAGSARAIAAIERSGFFVADKPGMSVRTVRHGDFVYLPNGGRKNVTDLLREAGVHPSVRNMIECLADGNQIVFVPGLDRSWKKNQLCPQESVINLKRS